MYSHVGGFIECCACRLAPLVPTVFTVGCEDHPLFGHIDPCKYCGGKGCEKCMMPGNLHFKLKTEAIRHLYEHINTGHKVPKYAIKRLKQESKIRNTIRPYVPSFRDRLNLLELGLATRLRKKLFMKAIIYTLRYLLWEIQDLYKLILRGANE
jgi:hypothetical protein